MFCRTGSTTDVAERRAHWSREHPSLRDWKLIDSLYLSKAEAQAAEDSHREWHGCDGAPGGPEMPGLVWWVYHFEYDPLSDVLERRVVKPITRPWNRALPLDEILRSIPPRRRTPAIVRKPLNPQSWLD